jgi:uncharacterized protein YqjF (DUF2071 family)
MDTFVSAYWSDLILLSYAVPDQLLLPCISPFELDYWDGQAYVSVVGFHFGRTRIVGVPPGPLLPKVANFSQWNLRTYVRSKDNTATGKDAKRGEHGVVFLKEFVPSPMVTGLVRTLYNENYVTAPLTQSRRADGDTLDVSYTLEVGSRKHTISARSLLAPSKPKAGSADEFFIERYWGSPGAYGNKVISFQIEHVPWNTYDISSCDADADFGLLYGKDWEFLNNRKPDYVAWCDGSLVGISWPTRRRLASMIKSVLPIG